jgi:hypothetical protein
MSEQEIDSVEAAEEASETISKEEARGSWRLWFAVLGSPLAWVGHLGVNYSLEEWFACSPSAHDKGHILGYDVNVVTLLVNTAMVLLAAASLFVAYRCYQELRGKKGGDTTERARWMAFAGLVEGGLFLGIILLGYLPAFFLGACETTP